MGLVLIVLRSKVSIQYSFRISGGGLVILVLIVLRSKGAYSIFI